jgi:hypothetical protein
LTCHSDFFEALIPEITFEQIAIKEKFNRDRDIVKPRIQNGMNQTIGLSLIAV